MCGVVGIFEYRKKRRVSRELLEAMNDAIVHRGPDEAGFLVRDHVGLAMRRLAIVDVAGGQQPIANEDGRIHIVYNGEVYNHRELRKTLEEAGHRFLTSSDTEVIVHLYEEYGDGAFAMLDGMFAFALLDERNLDGDGPKVLLVRDRLGKKPLYLADLGDAIVFGSELAPVVLDRRVDKTIDRQALHHYLTLLMIPEPWSIYRGVRKLPAGHYASCTAAGVVIASYVRQAHSTLESPAPRTMVVSSVRELIFRAVEKRLDLEVPFGAFLSGGLDSGSVVGVMSRILGSRVRTFSAGFEGPATHNELDKARLTARHFGTEHHELMLKPDLVKLAFELSKSAGEPFAISSALPLMMLSRSAQREVKVVLTGDGGDEIFAGYSHYRFEQWASRYRFVPEVADTWVQNADKFLPARFKGLGKKAARFAKVSRLDVGSRRVGWAAGFNETEKRALYATSYDFLSTGSLLEQRSHGLPDELGANAIDWSVYLPDEMLCKVDRMTMSASIEARSPLLDDDLVAFGRALPMAMRMPSRKHPKVKHLVRDALADILPPHLREGGKWGFNVPLDHWFRGEALGFVRDTLSPDRVEKRGVFDPRAVSELVRRHEAGGANLANRLFSLVMFEIWAAENHVDAHWS